MAIIDETYFINDINIAYDDLTVDNLKAYITKYEKKLFEQLFGYSLAKLVMGYDPDTSEQRIIDIVEGAEFIVNVLGNDVTLKWEGLKSTADNIVANFVWYWWQRGNLSLSSGIGNVTPTIENAKPGDLSMKAMHAYNNAVEQSQILYLYLDANKELYPEWIFEPLEPINSFDL